MVQREPYTPDIENFLKSYTATKSRPDNKIKFRHILLGFIVIILTLWVLFSRLN